MPAKIARLQCISPDQVRVRRSLCVCATCPPGTTDACLLVVTYVIVIMLGPADLESRVRGGDGRRSIDDGGQEFGRFFHLS